MKKICTIMVVEQTTPLKYRHTGFDTNDDLVISVAQVTNMLEYKTP